MYIRISTAALALALVSGTASAQTANPVAQAFRDEAASSAKNLIAAADEFPAAKYGYKPTPAQMSFGAIVAHLSDGNDYLCGKIGGMKAPTRTKVASTDTKDVLVARLRETFAFCTQALTPLDDSKLGEMIPVFFSPKPMSRAAVMTETTADWADHYSQSAIYMRLNGMLPPTAKKPAK
jgi:DinB superfamily